MLRYLPKRKDRTILQNRLNEYLNGRRRGKLRLPKYFPQEVQRLSDMSKAHIRRSQFWVKPRTEFDHRLPKRMVKWLRQVAPVSLWTHIGKMPIRKANSVAVPRLNKTDVPRISRPQWPSCISFSEMMYMSRAGKSLPVQDNFRSLKVFNHLTPRDIHDCHDLATRIVARQIVGIRFEMEVPKKFLKYFRYRDGFLILTVRHCLPIGLVRFLIGQWIKCPTSLWLVEPVRFKIFLKRHRYSDFIRVPRFLDTTIGCKPEPPKVKGKTSSAKQRYQKRRKAEKKIDQSFAEMFGLDPALS